MTNTHTPVALAEQLAAISASVAALSAPQVESDLGAVLSPSQAKAFISCPARWWYRYGMGLPDPAGSSLVRGKVVHKVAELYFRARHAGAVLEAEDLAEPFEQAWDSTMEGASFQAGEDVDAVKAQTAQLTRMYLDQVAPEIEPAIIDGALAMELPVTGRIGGVAVRGIIDLIDVHGRIIDLKSAGRKPSGVEAGYAFQLATYAEISPLTNGEAELVTLVATKTPSIVKMAYTVSDADRRYARVMYPAVQAAMKQGSILPNRSGNLCSRKHCNFWQTCEQEWGGRVKGEESLSC